MIEVVLFGAVGLLFFTLVATLAAEPRGARNELERTARSMGLRADASGLRGAIEGVPLHCEPPTRHYGWRVRATLACRFPEGVHASTLPGQGQPMPFHEDDVIFVEGPWTDLQRLLQHPAVQKALLEAFVPGNRIEIGDALRLTAPATAAQPIQEMVLCAVVLARALDGVWGELVAEVARTVGVDPARFEDVSQVEAQVEGIRMRVSRPVPGIHGTWELRWIAWLPEPLPQGTRIVAQQGSAGPDVLVNDPIIDKALRLSGDGIGSIRDRICDDAVRGLLLDVLCGHPGSVIHSDRIDWRIGDGALAPGARLRDVLRLVRVLS